MTHKPIFLDNITIEFPHKICFEDFTSNIQYGQRIAIIGRNGSGKSSLLNMIKNLNIDATIGYVPQIIENFDDLSGGQRFNKALTESIKFSPDILLLDEPTNHLDLKNRRSLMKMLNTYAGTLIIISHDVELLLGLIDIFWHIDNAKVNIFSGNYDDYIYEINSKCLIENELSRLERQKKDTHTSLMKEQGRASKSKKKGEKSIESKKWPTITGKAKALRAQETIGRKKIAIDNKKRDLNEKLSNLRLPEVIKPKFSIEPSNIINQTLVSVENGSCGFVKDILTNINITVGSKDIIAVKGDNGSGKTTLIKAILNDLKIKKSGNWYVTKDIGYLDQHYSTLDNDLTVLDVVKKLVPTWDIKEVRRHLNDFLFRKTEEVNNICSNLSGGERVRLCLAQIAAKTPKLLILDEITNNLDLETREHVIQVLIKFPGAILIISHDEDFIKEIGVKDSYILNLLQANKL